MLEAVVLRTCQVDDTRFVSHRDGVNCAVFGRKASRSFREFRSIGIEFFVCIPCLTTYGFGYREIDTLLMWEFDAIMLVCL